VFTSQQTRFVVDDVLARIDPKITDAVCDDPHVEPPSHVLTDPNFKSLSAYIHKKCIRQMQILSQSKSCSPFTFISHLAAHPKPRAQKTWSLT